MGLNLFMEKGVPVDQQKFTQNDLTPKPLSKLDDDAFTRVRINLLGGLESEAIRFGHSFAQMNSDFRVRLAKTRRIDQSQSTLNHWLIGSDFTPLELTIGLKQSAVEMTAAIAKREPDPELAQFYQNLLLENLDQLYRYCALIDRVEGKDANQILQSYTDIRPGRPLGSSQRAAEEIVKRPYDRNKTDPLSKFYALTLFAIEQQNYHHLMHLGPTLSDPTARQWLAEIASIQEQNITQIESMIDPAESWIEKWMLHEANEVYHYFSCLRYESNSRLKAIWEKSLDYELGHLQVAMECFKEREGRDPEEILPQVLPEPIEYQSQRNYIRSVLQKTLASSSEQDDLISQESPSSIIAAGYQWAPGTELTKKAA